MIFNLYLQDCKLDQSGEVISCVTSTSQESLKQVVLTEERGKFVGNDSVFSKEHGEVLDSAKSLIGKEFCGLSVLLFDESTYEYRRIMPKLILH